MFEQLFSNPIGFLVWIMAVAFGLTIHEFSHGYAAYLSGDGTAKAMGRLSFNPLRHLDLFGTLLLIFVGFGWAKPVQVNPAYFRKPRQDMFFVSIAGIGANISAALLLALFARLVGWENLGIGGQVIVSNFIRINVVLGVFNLIPFPPLDGSKILASALPEKQAMAFGNFNPMFGTIILAVIIFTPIRHLILDVPFMYVLRLFRVIGSIPFGGL